MLEELLSTECFYKRESMRFSEAMKMDEQDDGCLVANFDRSWWVVNGPNGGIIAALMVRAAQHYLGQDRCVRTVTTHFMSAPTEGPVCLAVTVERVGKIAGFAAVRMTQEDRLIATALVAVAAVEPALHEWEQREFPILPTIENSWLMRSMPPRVPLHSRWERYWGLGVPGVPETSTIPGGYEAGGWIRLSEPEPYDEALLAAMADSWIPAIMAHTDFAVHAPTLELTVQFRTDPRTLEMSDDAYCVAVFRQLSGREGFIDETGEIWSPDGQLLVLSRQLAVLLPRSDDMVGKWEFVGPQFRGRS